MRSAVVIFVLLLAGAAHAAEHSWLKWEELPPLPDSVGFAGAFAGVSNGALVVAGGANFPDGPPWQGHAKVWHDRVFVLADPKREWKQVEQHLPRSMGYGVSITTSKGVICIGGGDANEHFADVFRLEWVDGKLKRTDLPPLPVPLANAAGAMVGEVIYIAGGTESPAATTATKHFFSFDLSDTELRWVKREPWPGPARMLAVAGVQEKSLFLMSGARLFADAKGKPTREFLTDAYRFSPEAGWKRIADLPRPAVAAPSPAASIGLAHLLVFGGDDGKYFFGPPEQHGGFADDVLAYHTITNTWAGVAKLANPRAVTALVSWAGGFVVPSGEVRAGVRGPAVSLAIPQQTKTGFGLLNYVALGIYPLVMLAISYFVGRKSTSDEFFRGGQRIPWWAAGISIYATMLSSITYMAIPAKAYATDWAYFIQTFAIAAIAPMVAFAYLPFYRQLNVTSAYEYLEKRFNLATRWFGSASFLVLQLGRTAIVLYLPALALATVTQFDIVTCILIMGAISILMTFLGGVEAVVWTDVAQSVILLAGVVVSLAFVIVRSDQTIGAMFDRAIADGKFFGNMRWDWDWTVATGSVIFFGNLLHNLIAYTASQDVVQRYLTTKDQKQAARAILTNAAITIPSSILFFGAGTALFMFYKSHPQRLDPTIANDQIFPLFMVRELPAGVAGLVVAGIFAAAQPTSNLNSMATAYVTDFYQRLRPGASDAAVLRLAQRLTVLFGVLGTAIALVIAKLHMESIWDLFIQMIGLTGAALAGLFALGIFTRRAHGPGALVGAAVSVVVLFYVQRFTRMNFFLYGGTGILVCLVVGYIASLILPAKGKPLEGLTIYTARSLRQPSPVPAVVA
jgi:SSS family transporter